MSTSSSSYNGFPSQDAFHQHLRDEWARRSRQTVVDAWSGTFTPDAVQYEEDVATVRAHIARLAVLVERGVYPQRVLDSYVSGARERADWSEIPA